MEQSAGPRRDPGGPSLLSTGAALVTGGRRGIGRAICGDLASRGYDIVFVDLVDDDGVAVTRTLVESFGRRCSFIQADIAHVPNHGDLVERALAEHGRIDCLVNNAGVQVSVRGDLLDTEEDEFDRLVGVNLRGTFFLTKIVAKAMLAQAAPGKRRSIITITSANAHLVSPEKGAYCVSKAALSMAMQAFALRLAADGIHVYEVRPGLIDTDMTADVREHYNSAIEDGTVCALRRWGRPEDIAGAVGALAEGAIPFSTGDIYNVGGGMHIPRL